MPLTSSPPPHLCPLPPPPTSPPSGEEESARVAKGDERDVDLAVAAARKAFDSGAWPKMSAAERGRIVWKLGDLIIANLDEMAPFPNNAFNTPTNTIYSN